MSDSHRLLFLEMKVNRDEDKMEKRRRKENVVIVGFC